MFSDDNSEIEFFGNNLWCYYDNIISNNNLNFDYYGFDKDGKISAPKFKISIHGKTANKDAKITLDSCSLYKFSYQLKSDILKNIKIDIEKFKTDQKWSHGFSFNCFKKNIYITIMWNDLSNSAVIRFMIGEKERTILESDKVYVPIVDFFSFCEILNQSFNNYVNLCSICNLESNIMRLQKITDNIASEPIPNNRIADIPTITSLSTSSIEDVLKDVDLKEISGNQTDHDKAETLLENIIEKQSADEESVKNQNDFDSFLKENRDKYELDLPETSETVENNEVKDHFIKNELTEKSKFIDKVCGNNFALFEQLIFNTSNEILPFDSFVNTIKNLSEIDFKDGMTDNDYVSVNYVISDNIKYHINQMLEKKVKLPSSITPIIVHNDKKDLNKIDTMYYLLLFYIYLSKLRNVLSEKSNNSIDNKEYFSYVLKTISNPLVFSYLPDIQEDVIKNELGKRYYELKESGFFKEFLDGINFKLKINGFDFRSEDLNESVSKIYQSVIKFKDKLGIESSFNKKLMKVSYEQIKKFNLNLDVIKKIIHFDTCFVKYGKINEKVDLNSYDDVPVPVLNLYGIKSVKFDNTIILKYFKDNFKDFVDLEKIKRINKNVYDILDEINISNYNTLQLRALYFWDVDVLPKNLTYFAFKKLVDESSLERNELISMILNRTIVTDKNFFSSFLISATDGSNV